MYIYRFSYNQKSLEDLALFVGYLHQVLLERGVAVESISNDEIKLFCQNC